MNESANELLVNELDIEARDGGSQFSIRATPRGRRNALEGIRAGALLVSVTAAPEDGAANAAIIALIAKSLKLAKSAIGIRRGHTSRDKTMWLALTPEELRARLASAGKT
jgi:uncharacterized protein YggU (UPF0235/DUF167 family)